MWQNYENKVIQPVQLWIKYQAELSFFYQIFASEELRNSCFM